MLTQEIIRKKRDGIALTQEEIDYLISGMMDGSVAESQMAAFAMAVFFKGMDLTETRHLTESLLLSGSQLQWDAEELDAPTVDKHSTGGLGDKVSLIIAPLLAACGFYMPMISGRSLGHTGGTLDKMDAIPGYNTQPELALFKQVVKNVGCAIVGQTKELAPADKMLYAIRDITATVESIPLITASILSKKIAAGLDSLVIDVKVGSGSFNATLAEAEILAKNLVNVGNANGMKTSACITDMNQVLGHTMGNALEVKEAIEFLNGSRRDSRLEEVVYSLGAELLLSSEACDTQPQAIDRLRKVMDSGQAEHKFNQMVSHLGGPDNITETYNDHLPKATTISPYYPPQDSASYFTSIDGRALGNLVISLGGGRRKTEDNIDYDVGFSDIIALGDAVASDKPMLNIHAKSTADVTQAALELDKIFSYSDTKYAPASPIMAIIRSSD